MRTLKKAERKESAALVCEEKYIKKVVNMCKVKSVISRVMQEGCEVEADHEL